MAMIMEGMMQLNPPTFLLYIDISDLGLMLLYGKKCNTVSAGLFFL